MLGRIWRGLSGGLDRAADWLGFGCVLLCIAVALRPVFHDLELYGGHDWDEMSAHRLLTVKALLQFRQLPFWMPYACGGFSEWGNVQGASNVVSPFLPFYLLLDLRHALRIELLGTVLISALGTWALAGQFTRSAAARTLACLVFVANGRFALQAATGHLWHLQYCYVPWVFWAFERLLAEERFPLGPLCVGGGAFASMVYSGGIYPLPHAALLLVVYALARAGLEKDWRPLLAMTALGALGVGLSAPRLLSMALDFSERPRLVASTEAIDFGVLWQALVAPDQMPGRGPVAVSQWGWHEYGMYIGWAPALLLLLGALWWAPRRELALKLTGAVALVLGFGAFHPLAPWTLLHQVGLFRSQHVPTRWLYPAVLLFGVAAAAAFGRSVARLSQRRNLDLALLGGCLLLAVDIGRESSQPLAHAFWMRARPVRPAAAFEQFERPPRGLQYQQRDYAPEAVPATLAGVGVLQCTPHASLNLWAPKAANGRPFGMGARGRESADYRGEVFTASGTGMARIVGFSPNRIVVEVAGARVGDRLVINQNFDPGWSVDGRPAEPYRDALAASLSAPNGRYTFRFWPRGLTPGLVLLALTCCILGVCYRRRRRPPHSAPRSTSPSHPPRAGARSAPVATMLQPALWLVLVLGRSAVRRQAPSSVSHEYSAGHVMSAALH